MKLITYVEGHSINEVLFTDIDCNEDNILNIFQMSLGKIKCGKVAQFLSGIMVQYALFFYLTLKTLH